MKPDENLEQKISDLRTLFESRGKKSIILSKQKNVSWLLGGRSFVNIATVDSLVDVVVSDDGLTVVTNNIEAKRLAEEEFTRGVEFRTYEWYLPGVRLEAISDLAGVDHLSDGECEPELRQLRTVLSTDDQEAFAALGRDSADAMQKTCLSIAHGVSENHLAGVLAANCFERGVEPIVILVGADERLPKHRHPLPTAAPIDHYAMISLCGRRSGQVVSLTRFVSFGRPAADIVRKRDALHRISAMLMAETRPGANCGEIFEKLAAAYDSEGYKDEWKLHHQGGLTGYDAREEKVLPHSNLQVTAGQVFAWNPSITGFKSEDTFLVGDSVNTVLTETAELPFREFEFQGIMLEMPDILIF